VTETGSSVPRRQLGRLLKEARERANVALEAAARELEFSRNKMYRIEAGASPLRKVDVLAMCGLYDVQPQLTEVLVALAAETKAKGWWHSYGDVLPNWFELYVSLEAAACQLRHYGPSLVPGLLQTGEYAKALFQTTPGRGEADVDRLAALRLERQRLLSRRAPKAPTLDVILDEAVLRRPIADRVGMGAQLRRLGSASENANVRVRVLPFTAGPHRASPGGSFVLLDFAADGSRPPEPPTVYSESLTGALYLDKPQEVQTYAEVWRTLEELTLDVDQSKQLIDETAKEYADA
jgi:hypothetical protein